MPNLPRTVRRLQVSLASRNDTLPRETDSLPAETPEERRPRLAWEAQAITTEKRLWADCYAGFGDTNRDAISAVSSKRNHPEVRADDRLLSGGGTTDSTNAMPG